jgi:hypothetical protein
MQFSQVDIDRWQQMADLTLSKCRQTCKHMGSCCNDIYCEFAEEFAEKEFGQTFRKTGNPARYLNTDGTCAIPPHFRMLCTIQQCEISGYGLDPKDPEWTKRYWKLRKQLDAAMDKYERD